MTNQQPPVDGDECPPEILAAVEAGFAASDLAYRVAHESDRARAFRREHIAQLKAERAEIVRRLGLYFSGRGFADPFVMYGGKCAGCLRPVPLGSGRLTGDEWGQVHVWCTDVTH